MPERYDNRNRHQGQGRNQRPRQQNEPQPDRKPMVIANAGLAFNKSVFRDLNPDDRTNFREQTYRLHKALLQLPLNNEMVSLLDVISSLVLKDGKDEHGRFLRQAPLTVAWPGLMMGLGYGHGAKTTTKDEKTNHPFETEVKTGFYFDFTTGLPVLPGSTVKGILRSFFPGRYKGSKDLKEAVGERIKSVLKTLFNKDFSDEQLKELEEVIFEGKENGKSIPSTEQDIFFDAFPCLGTTAKVFETNQPEVVNNVFLGEDVLTPHHHPLKEPVPLKHLKILPGVKIKFQFLLNNKGGLTASEKEKLFTHLLREFGAGARKGTGFGQFEPENIVNTLSGNGYIEFDDLDTMGWETESDENDLPLLVEQPSSAAPNVQPQTMVEENDTWEDPKSIKINDIIPATIKSYQSGSLTLILHVKGKKLEVKVNGIGKIGDLIKVKVVNIEGRPERPSFKLIVKKVDEQ